MLEEGVVTGLKGEYALVEKRIGSLCGDCSQKGVCGTGDPGEKVVIVALNPLGARAGDHVQLSISSSLLLRSAFYVYIFPVGMLISGSALGALLSKFFTPFLQSDFFSVFLGTLFFSLAIFRVRAYNKKVETEKGSKPVITRIIPT